MVVVAAIVGGAAFIVAVASMARTLVALATVTIALRAISAVVVVCLTSTSNRESLHSKIRAHSGPVFLPASLTLCLRFCVRGL